MRPEVAATRRWTSARPHDCARPGGSGIAMEGAGSTNTSDDGRTAGGARNTHKRDEG